MRRTTKTSPLLDVIPKLTPKFTRPKHLAPIAALFDRAMAGEEVRATATTPPRYGKSELIKHAAVRLLLARPEARVGYASYSARFAEKKSREIRELYKRAGGHVDADASSRADWRTGTGEGGLWAGGIEGGWTGEGFDLLLVDDPIKDRARAESGLEREKLWEWFTNVGLTRLEPHASCLAVHTRWHTDDLIGRLNRDNWEHVHLPAIDSNGRALWPERYSAEKLHAIRAQIGEYGWASLYMGQPHPRGGAVFSGCNFYDALPTGRMNIRIGIDLAYSTKSHADYSVALVLGEVARVFFVLDVVRVQVEAPDFMQRLAALRARYGEPTLTGYFGGTEKGTLDMMRRLGLNIAARKATQDKFTRAQPVAAAWNAGRILVPRQAPWLDAFVSEIVSFTGIGDVHDDQVDALAGAFDASPRDARIGTASSSIVATPSPTPLSFDDRPMCIEERGFDPAINMNGPALAQYLQQRYSGAGGGY